MTIFIEIRNESERHQEFTQFCRSWEVVTTCLVNGKMESSVERKQCRRQRIPITPEHVQRPESQSGEEQNTRF
jgi:hypothetical protein